MTCADCGGIYFIGKIHLHLHEQLTKVGVSSGEIMRGNKGLYECYL